MKYINSFLLIISIVLFSACTVGKPNENDAKEVLEKSLSKYGAEVLSFTKLNGKEYKILGQDVYELKFSANVIYPKGANTQCLKKNRGSFGSMSWANSSTNCGMFNDNIRIKNIGEKENIKGVVLFEKTDKGWVGKAYEKSMFGLDKI